MTKDSSLCFNLDQFLLGFTFSTTKILVSFPCLALWQLSVIKGGAAAVLQVVVDQDRDALNDLDTKDKLVLKDKYEMELGTEAILTNNLAAINPNQEIVSDTDLETSETKNTNFSKVTLSSTSERIPNQTKYNLKERTAHFSSTNAGIKGEDCYHNIWL